MLGEGSFGRSSVRMMQEEREISTGGELDWNEMNIVPPELSHVGYRSTRRFDIYRDTHSLFTHSLFTIISDAASYVSMYLSHSEYYTVPLDISTGCTVYREQNNTIQSMYLGRSKRNE